MKNGFLAKMKQFLKSYKIMLMNGNFICLLFSYSLVHGVLMSFFMVARKMIGGMIDGQVNLKLGTRIHIRQIIVYDL